MLRLALILHIFIGATLGGVLLVVALVAGFDGLWPLLGALLAGFVIAIPIAGMVAKRLIG
jgi:hypothetical protein